jgi:hypothetical protein
MKNFVGQPSQGGEVYFGITPFASLTAYDLTTEVKPNRPTLFAKEPIFVDNCKNCSNSMNNFTNADGSTLDTILDIGKFGIGTWSNEQARKSAEEQAQLALQIEQTRLAQERAKAAADQAKASSASGKIKAYTVPLIVTGVLVIGGIAAYFYFKKKKIN